MPRAQLSPRTARAALLVASVAAASTLGACGEKQEPDLSTVPEPVETATTPAAPPTGTPNAQGQSPGQGQTQGPPQAQGQARGQ